MQYLQPYPLFETLIPVPSHEEISQLPEWKRMDWCSPRWITGNRAYANGTRSFRSGWNYDEYRIYPKKGELTNDRDSLMKGLKFDSQEDWNDSLLKINAYLIYKALSVDRFRISPYGIAFKSRVPIEKALRGEKIKDPENVLRLLLYKRNNFSDIQKLDRIIPLLYDTVNLSDDINKRIEEDPSSIDSETLKSAIDGGFFVPNEFAKTVITIGGYGFFDD